MFLNAILLAGIGAALVPLILHFLSKARYRTVDWGAMLFLDSAEAKTHNSSRLRQYILLAVRMLIVALIALAMARPIAGGSLRFFAQRGPVWAVVLIDGSASMLSTEAGRTRFDVARQAAADVLATLRPGDQACVRLIGSGGTVGAWQFSSDLQSIAAQIADLKPTGGAMDLATVFADCTRQLDRIPGQAVELFLVTDQQASSWSAVDDASASAIRSSLLAHSPAALLRVIPIGSRSSERVAIEKVSLVGESVLKDTPAQIEAVVRNCGSSERTGLSLLVVPPGKPPQRTTVNLAAGATATLRVTLTGLLAGSQVIGVSIDAGGAIEDHVDLALDVESPIQVALLTTEVSAGARGEIPLADWLTLALQPFKSAGENGGDPAALRVVANFAAMDRVLDPLDDVVIVANVQQISQRHAREIEQFVSRGGGVIFAGGEFVKPDLWNAVLFRGGAGMLPVQLDPRGASVASPLSVARVSASNPIFAFVGGLTVPPIAVRDRLAVARLTPEAAVVAELSDNSPWVVTRNFGLGRALFIASSLDSSWSDFPGTAWYLPFIQSTVRFARAGSRTPMTLDPGDAIEASFRITNAKSAQITLPNGSWRDAELRRAGDRVYVRWTNTTLPGKYIVRVRTDAGEQRSSFVVRPTPGERDQAMLDPVAWAKLESSVGFERIVSDSGRWSDQIRRSRGGREIWLAVIVLAVGLLLTEMVLTRYWSSAGAVR